MAGKALLRWFDIRIGGKSEDIDRLMRKPIKGGARWMFSLGALNLYLFVNQMLTGIFLNLYYVPSPDHAYDAVKFIQSETDFGWLVRGLHFWGASAMIVSLMLHVTRVYTFGAYKKPRELMWLSGALLLLLTVGFAFTGYLLPWDQKAYWATVVGTNVAGTAPVLGPYIVKVLRGGAEVSNITLTRFFTIHTMFLPWTLAAVAAFHLTLQQLVDHTPPWNPEKAKVVAPFFPDQVLKDMVAALGVFVLLIVLAYSAPPTLEALADPTDKTYNPRPEWYFFFLFQLLRYFEGRLEIIGTMVIPNLFVVVLLALPFIDRNPELNPRKRPVAMSALVFVLAGYITLTLLASTSPPKGASAAGSPTPGRLLYAKLGCGTCHSIAGAGG
ncbi:MAG TPA: cytochrome bc complex cytochrome b subunit, partial [Nitrospirota bacterium]